MEDLKIRQKCEEMIAYGYVALRQFPKFERHVLAAAGEIIVAFPASAFASLCPPPVIGGGAVAMFQIEINAPLSEMDQIWQGPAILAGVI